MGEPYDIYEVTARSRPPMREGMKILLESAPEGTDQTNKLTQFLIEAFCVFGEEYGLLPSDELAVAFGTALMAAKSTEAQAIQ